MLAAAEFTVIQNLLGLLSRRERRRLVLISLLLAVSGFLEMIGVGVVFAYLALLNAASSGATTLRLPWLLTWISGDHALGELALCGGFSIFGVFLVKAVSIFAIHYVAVRFVFAVFERFSVTLLHDYMRLPLVHHLSRSSAEIQRDITFQPI